MKSNSPKRPEFCLCCVVSHDIILSPLIIFVSTTAGNQRSFQHATLQSLSKQAKEKPRTHPQHEARHPPCCIRPHAFPRSKGRSKPRTAFALLVLHRHSFSGSKGRSSAPTQISSHQKSWSPVLSFLLLLLLLPLLLPCCNQLPL